MENDLLLIILCIGTMRVRGDSLGPLVGSRLCRMQFPGIRVYGTKEAPVHAGNLSETLEEISREHPGTPVLAWMPLPENGICWDKLPLMPDLFIPAPVWAKTFRPSVMLTLPGFSEFPDHLVSLASNLHRKDLCKSWRKESAIASPNSSPSSIFY